jgi:hypothetical protein
MNNDKINGLLANLTPDEKARIAAEAHSLKMFNSLITEPVDIDGEPIHQPVVSEKTDV